VSNRHRHRWFEIDVDGAPLRICGDPKMPRETMEALIALGRAMTAMGEKMTTTTERDEAARACRGAFLDWYGGLQSGQALTMRVGQVPEDGVYRAEFLVSDADGDYGWWGYQVERDDVPGSRYHVDGWRCEQFDEGDPLLSEADEWKETL
jgi:hypothetical protein